MYALILVGDTPVWCGPTRGSAKKLLWAAKLRSRFPSVAQLRQHLGLPGGDDDYWDSVCLVLFDGGKPVSQHYYPVTPLGNLS